MKVFLTWMSIDESGADALIDECAEPEDQEHGGGRRVSVLARALARSLACRTTGEGPWRIQADRQGKPHFINMRGERGPALSITHTGRLAAAAVCAGGDLGIDLERHRFRDHSALAAQAFGPNEQAAVARGGGAEFYRIWTLREAFAKATGQGLPQVMDGADRFDADRLGTVWAAEIDGARWRFASSLFSPEHCLGVALRCPVSAGRALRPLATTTPISSTIPDSCLCRPHR